MTCRTLKVLAEAKTLAFGAHLPWTMSADGQVALGQVMLFSEWDWILRGERSFQRALVMNRITRERSITAV